MLEQCDSAHKCDEAVGFTYVRATCAWAVLAHCQLQPGAHGAIDEPILVIGHRLPDKTVQPL